MEIPFFLGRLEELASGELEALWSRPRDWVFTARRPRAMIASMKGPREDVMAAALRALAFIAALFSPLAATGDSWAQSYPTRPVRLVVPFGAGGLTDVIARIVAQKLSEIWGQQVYTENIPGAGGNTGVATVARAPADGYTILVVSTGFMVNPSMYAKVPYDPDYWRGDIAKAVATSDVKERLETLGFAPVANTPDEFGARIKLEIAKWSKVVHDANIKAD